MHSQRNDRYNEGGDLVSFFAYEDIPQDVLDKTYTTSKGKNNKTYNYNMNHNEKLRIEAPFRGKGHSGTTSQGWERNKYKYFKKLSAVHPEMFSKRNLGKINDRLTPIVDQKMIDCIPQLAPFRGQSLKHHHIGGDGEVVAVPASIHKGSGEIHNVERDAGITEKCQRFSAKCQSDPDALGKTASEIRGRNPGQQEAVQSNGTHALSRQTKSPADYSGSKKVSLSRADVLRQNTNKNTPAPSRSDALHQCSVAPAHNNVSRAVSLKSGNSVSGSHLAGKEPSHSKGTSSSKSAQLNQGQSR